MQTIGAIDRFLRASPFCSTPLRQMDPASLLNPAAVHCDVFRSCLCRCFGPPFHAPPPTPPQPLPPPCLGFLVSYGRQPTVLISRIKLLFANGLLCLMPPALHLKTRKDDQGRSRAGYIRRRRRGRPPGTDDNTFAGATQTAAAASAARAR